MENFFAYIGFMEYQGLEVIQYQIRFYTHKQFYIKLFSLS